MEETMLNLNAHLRKAGRAFSTKNEYDLLKTDEERFDFSLGLFEEYDVLPKIEIETKSCSISAIKRKAANDLYKSNFGHSSRHMILALYTESIAYAEADSKELAFSYGNRSAVLWEASLFDHCLLDIERALKLNYPDHLRNKLLWRQMRCIKILNRHESSLDEGITSTINKMHDCSIKIESELQYKNDLQSDKQRVQRKLIDESKYCPDAPGGNPEVPGASDALAIAWNEQKGRHIVATRTIYPGEVLAIERGFSSVLDPDRVYTHCSNCLKQVFSGVPCFHCLYAVFCNEACHDEAWLNYHRVECEVVRGLFKFKFSLMGLLSLRLLIRAVKSTGDIQTLKNQVDSLETGDASKDPRTKGFVGRPPMLNVQDYRSVYALNTNSECRHSTDLFGRSANAVVIMYCLLTMSDFLGEKMPSGDVKVLRKNPWTVFLGGLVMRHQQIIPTNGDSLQEEVELFQQLRGSALLPFLSLFNHSCDSMVTHTLYDRSVVVRAVKTITAGEEVCANYGIHYIPEPVWSRKKTLARRYFFDCQCRPCLENWPTLERLPSFMDIGLLRSVKWKLAEALKPMERYVRLATIGKISELDTCKVGLETMLKTLYEEVDEPCREIYDVTETLKRIYALGGANFQNLCD